MTTPDHTAELLPCPFCGTAGRIIHNERERYTVACNDESCIAFSGSYFMYEKPEYAAAHWNARTANTLHAQLERERKENAALRALLAEIGNIANAIRARDGAPEGYAHEYFYELVDRLHKAVDGSCLQYSWKTCADHQAQLAAKDKLLAMARDALLAAENAITYDSEDAADTGLFALPRDVLMQIKETLTALSEEV